MLSFRNEDREGNDLVVGIGIKSLGAIKRYCGKSKKDIDKGGEVIFNMRKYVSAEKYVGRKPS